MNNSRENLLSTYFVAQFMFTRVLKKPIKLWNYFWMVTLPLHLQF